MDDPNSNPEEVYALIDGLDGVRTPSALTGGCGLLVLVHVFLFLAWNATSGVVAIIFAVLTFTAALGPGFLLASAAVPRAARGVEAHVRQAHLLTAFWWVFAVTGLAFGLVNGVLFGLPALLGM